MDGENLGRICRRPAEPRKGFCTFRIGYRIPSAPKTVLDYPGIVMRSVHAISNSSELFRGFSAACK